MDAVTAHTRRDILIASSQTGAVNARSVFLNLVHPHGRIEFLHQVGIAVTLAAKRRYLHRRGLADVPATRILREGLIRLRRIAPVAIDTRQAADLVNVVIEKAGWL